VEFRHNIIVILILLVVGVTFLVCNIIKYIKIKKIESTEKEKNTLFQSLLLVCIALVMFALYEM
jgi:uncharacterized membrane protein YidH (DUF202 family)